MSLLVFRPAMDCRHLFGCLGHHNTVRKEINIFLNITPGEAQATLPAAIALILAGNAFAALKFPGIDIYIGGVLAYVTVAVMNGTCTKAWAPGVNLSGW